MTEKILTDEKKKEIEEWIKKQTRTDNIEALSVCEYETFTSIKFKYKGHVIEPISFTNNKKEILVRIVSDIKSGSLDKTIELLNNQ